MHCASNSSSDRVLILPILDLVGGFHLGIGSPNLLSVST